MQTQTGVTKPVAQVYGPGSEHWVGDGFPVRNLFPSNGVQSQIDPFLMLDYAGPYEFPPSEKPRGVGEHPHRGFETVTIAYLGSVAHRDSGGHAGVIGPGDVQWMTAASGVVHEEMHDPEFTRRGGTFEMVQLWVNLPRAYKMTAPRYQNITSAQIPVVDFGEGAQARVIAGELHGTKGAAATYTPVNVIDIRLSKGGKGDLQLPAGHNTGIVLLRGTVVLNGVTRLEGEAKLALLSAEGDTLTLDAGEETLLLLLSGVPIKEPVASYGPFVMNTRAELMQAFEDYQSGRMGRL